MLIIQEVFAPATDAVAHSLALSALAGILPLAAFFVLLGVFKVPTHFCALISLALAVVIAIVGFHMPIGYSLLSAGYGAAFGFFPIIYIIIAAVWLYNLTEKSGRAADVRAVFNAVSRGDRRVQIVLVAFCFCGLLEGLAGFGAPVAIVAAVLVTLGIDPLKAAVITMVGNAINVCYGAMSIPLTTAGRLGGTKGADVAFAAGHLTPFFVCWLPLLLIVIADGLRGLKQLWMLGLVTGVVSAFGHLFVASYFSYELTAVLSSLMGFAAASLLLVVWKPTTPEDHLSADNTELTTSRAILGLMPYWLVVIVFGVAKLWTLGINVPKFLASFAFKFPWPGLDGNLIDPITKKTSTGTIFSVSLMDNPGTMIILTALVVSIVFGLTDSDGKYPFSFAEGIKTFGTTIVNLRMAILTIATIMALAFVMNFSGQTVAIGAFLAGAGGLFAFLSPVLGWIGTAVTGSATSANALFAKLQATAASGAKLNPNILLAANSIGGGIGKIVSPQNLAIAATAISKPGSEPEILRKVAPYSFLLLIILSCLTFAACNGLMGGYLS